MTLRRTTLVGALLLALVLGACTPLATTTVLTASALKTIQGQSVTFTARVAASPPGATPSGAMQLKDGTATLGTVPTTNGVATLTTSALAAGRHTIHARFIPATGTTWAQSSSTLTIVVAAPRYHVALGDSLAVGLGAPAGKGYVPLVTAAEAARVPGLTLQNLSCSGATTTSMLTGGGWCSYAQGTQMAAAEAFLLAHRGAVSFITIDIGLNDITRCISSTGTDPTCAVTRISILQANLVQILTRLHAVAPGVPVVGMTYYNPFLAYWVTGNQSAAASSTAGIVALDNALSTTYLANSSLVANVAAAFDTANSAPTGTFNGLAVPQNVANICTWTHMCTVNDLHANALGHHIMATTFTAVINSVVPAG